MRRIFLSRGLTLPESRDHRLFLTASQTPSLDLKPGHQLGAFPKSEVQKKMHFPIEVAFGEPEIVKGKPVIELLWQMFQSAQGIIFGFDSAGLLD
jgi:hypothetical protein